MSEWRVYRRIGTVTARPYVEGELLPAWVSISDADADNGSPKVGDMIARDALTLHDEWLISADFFARHYEATPDRTFTGPGDEVSETQFDGMRVAHDEHRKRFGDRAVTGSTWSDCDACLAIAEVDLLRVAALGRGIGSDASVSEELRGLASLLTKDHFAKWADHLTAKADALDAALAVTAGRDRIIRGANALVLHIQSAHGVDIFQPCCSKAQNAQISCGEGEGMTETRHVHCNHQGDGLCCSPCMMAEPRPSRDSTGKCARRDGDHWGCCDVNALLARIGATDLQEPGQSERQS